MGDKCNERQIRNPARDESEAADAFLNRMLNFTQRLIRVDDHDGDETASGLLVTRYNRVFLLTAGHVLKEGRWIIETNWIVDDQVLSLNTGNSQSFYSDGTDFAWSEIDVAGIAEQLRVDEKMKDKQVELAVYTGPLDAPLDAKMSYGFASWKAQSFLTGSRILVRDPCFELAMEYCGVEPKSKLLMFKPNRGHRGHAYYKGCSGAGIAGVDGRIVALVVRGHPEANPEFILGVPVQDKEPLIGGNRPVD